MRSLLLILGLAAGLCLADTADYTLIELDPFIGNNRIPDDGSGKNQRTLLRPVPVQFTARLLEAPQPGQFALVYDALNLWASEQPGFNVSHSAFLQSAGQQVLATYVTRPAAARLQQLYDQAGRQPVRAHLYALHLYNYSKGPRLLILSAEPEQP